MLFLIGFILSIGATIGTYFGLGLQDKSLWYLLFMVVLLITYFIVYLNIYWLIVLILTFKYRNKEYVGKVNKFYLLNIRMIAGFIIPLQGFKVKKKDFKKIPKEPSLILFNHISDYDPWVLYKLMRGRYAFVGKKNLLGIPVVRQLASSIGTLYVSDNKEENYQMVDWAVEYITQKNTSVAIAPEGTRNKTGELKPFKHGGFNIALRSKCPVVLIGFKGMEDILKSTKKFHKGTVSVEVFDVIESKEYENMSAGELAEMCERKYKEYLGQK